MRVALDTDIVVAAMRSPLGASAGLLRASRQGRVTLVGSVALCVDYKAVCTRQEHAEASGLSAREVSVFLDAIIAMIEPANTWFLWRPQLRDANDEMVLEAAVNGCAEILVSFNLRHFASAAARFGLKMLQPGPVLRRLP